MVGRGTYIDHRGRHHALRAGSVFQRFPNQIHGLHVEAGAVRCYVSVPCQILEVLVLMGVTCPTRPVFEVTPDVNLLRECASIRNELDRCAEQRLPEVLVKAQTLIPAVHRRSLPSASGSAVERALQLMAQDTQNTLCLPELAKDVGLSYSKFRRQFVERYGLAPAAYRIRRRIERSLQLMRDEQLPLKEIAVQLGYSDVYSFSAQFKQAMGTSPGAYRTRQFGV